MSDTASQNSVGNALYPPIGPFDSKMMAVSGGHRIYVEQCGNPKGMPVIVLHGGPGGGCSPAMRRFFDPEHYRIILFDQRGCGKSKPTASVDENTTWHLVADIEQIRVTLGIEKWFVFGGSWGATLALIYAQTHSQRVRHLALRGVFLMTRAELKWFYGGGAARFWPEHWADFVDIIPAAERGDLIAAYNKRLFSDDLEEQTTYARAWCRWESALATLAGRQGGGQMPAEYARAFARLENHYFVNDGFLAPNQQILDNMYEIADIPGTIVQGRYDMICPPVQASMLAALWPSAELKMIATAGHAMSEPGITKALVETMNGLKTTMEMIDG